MIGETDLKNLGLKLVKILGTIEKVSKSGYNDFQRYEYATEADILDAVRQGLVDNKVFITQSSKVIGVKDVVGKDGKVGFITSVETEHTFIDAESGETHTVTSVGQGHDSLDKGVYKAITGATKYFYLKNFMVSTGDDPENDGGSKPSPQKAPAPKLAAPKAQPAPQSQPAAKPTGGYKGPGLPKAAPAQATTTTQVPKTNFTSKPKAGNSGPMEFGGETFEPTPVAEDQTEQDAPYF